MRFIEFKQSSTSPLKYKLELSPQETEKVKESYKKSSWARLLSKVFGIDVLKCECGSELKPVSAIIKGDEIKRYLRHLGLDADPPDQEERETEDKSAGLNLFEADSYEKVCALAHPEEFPIINHD